MTGEQNGYNLEMGKKGEADNSVVFKCVLCTWHGVRQKGGTAVSRYALVSVLNELRLLQDTH